MLSSFKKLFNKKYTCEHDFVLFHTSEPFITINKFFCCKKCHIIKKEYEDSDFDLEGHMVEKDQLSEIVLLNLKSLKNQWQKEKDLKSLELV